MAHEILLYIGGCADGERRKTTHHKMMVCKYTGKLQLTSGPIDDSFKSCITQHLYRMDRVRGPHQEFSVMVWDELTADEMLIALISKYPAPKDDD